jgi:protein-tyrosine phosphatase
VGAAGRSALGSLNLQRIIDLRDDDEVLAAPSGLEDVVPTHRVPLVLGSVASFFERDISLLEMYLDLLENSATRIVDVVRGISGAQPVLVHCTAGKDRTGLTVALTLAAVGVERAAVVADYALSEAMLPAERNRRIVSWLRSSHPEAVHAEELAVRSPARVMTAILEEVERSHGSAAGYLTAAGLDEDELARLRARLIEPAS